MEVLNGRAAWSIRLGRCMDIRTFSTIHFWYITHSRAFPRWREQSLSPGMQACRQLPPCTPWLSCRFTKPGRSNRCTRVVPTWGWCRSCAWRLTSLYERWKSQRGPSGRRCPPGWSRSTISGSTWQRWRTSTRQRFLDAPATPSRALPSSSRQYSSNPRQSSTIHRCPRGQASVCPSPWAPSCVLQSWIDT